MAMSVISDRRPEEVRPARFDLSIRKLIDIRKPFGDLRSRLAQTDELSPAGAVMAGDHDVLDGVCAGRDHSLHLIKVADPIGPDEPRIPWTLVDDVVVQESRERLPSRIVDGAKHPCDEVRWGHDSHSAHSHGCSSCARIRK